MPGRSPSDFRWTAASPLFVGIPFGILSVFSLTSPVPWTVFRLVGVGVLLFLSGLCVGLGFKPRRATPNPTAPESKLNGALQLHFSDLNRVVTIDVTDGISGLNLTRTFAAIAVAALLVVLSLVTKQLQRGGSISLLGGALSAAFVLVPLGLLRVLRGQMRQLQFAPRGVKALRLDGSLVWDIRTEHVQHVSIFECSSGNNGELHITQTSGHRCIPLSSHAIAQVRRVFECVPQPPSSERGQTHVVRAGLASASLSQTEA